MREYSTPPSGDAVVRGNVTGDVVRNAERLPDRVQVSRRAGDGTWQDVTAARFRDEVVAVARGLVAGGVAPGDRVALMSSTRYEWTLLDYAIWFAGAVSVPVYDSCPAEQLAWVLGESGTVAAVVETPDHRDRLDSVRDGLPTLDRVWTIDEPADPGGGAVAALVAAGRDVDEAEVERRRSALGPDDLATLLYTSGTTGRPKGCMITHGNLGAELDAAMPELDELFAEEDAVTLLFLPLAHVFARIVQVGCVRAGVRFAHCGDPRGLARDLAELRPTFLLAVPRVFEKLFNTASQRAVADGRGTVFGRAVDVAIAWSRGQERGRPALRVRAEHAVMERLVYERLRQTLGGRCRYAVSGGAPLGERLGHFYRGIGIPVLEGYGLTETTAACTVNLPGAQKVGTVGRPLPGTSVRVAEDGELLFRGGQVFVGYWHDDAATRAVLDPGGWFHTGDLGEVDDEGFVRITGRKKEILVTAGGKNVAPAVLEDRVRAHPLVSQVLVVGDGQPFVGALVTLDADQVRVWAAGRGLTGRAARPEALAENADLRAEIQSAVDDANRAVSQAESIRRFVVLPEDWTEERGQLTPSLKLKRNLVLRQHKDDVARLYL